MRIFDQEWLRGVFVTFVAAGAIALAYAGWTYASTTLQLQENYAYQVRGEVGEDGELAIESDAQARVLYAADREMRELLQARWRGVMVGGIGMSVIALGWIGMNLMAARREHHQQQAVSDTSVPTT